MSTSSPRSARASLSAIGFVTGLTLAFAAPTHAATVRVDGTTIVYDAVAGEVNGPRFERATAGSSTVRVLDFGAGTTLTPGAGCTNSDNPFLVGNEVLCTAPAVTLLAITTLDRDDRVQLASNIGPAVITDIDLGTGDDFVDDQSGGRSVVAGDEGNDEISTYGGNDEIDAGPGSDDVGSGDGDDAIRLGAGLEDVAFGGDGEDTILGDAGVDKVFDGDGDDEVDGGAGDDSLAGNAGADDLSGGTGDDRFGDDLVSDGPSRDVLRGGSGFDVVDYGTRVGSAPMTVTLDGVANDGQDDDLDGVAEEGDNVGPDGDVERVQTGGGDDLLIGSDRADELDAGFGDDEIRGLGGDDELAASVGDDLVLGGAGDDDIDGSSGRDRLFGEDGDDAITGSTGDDGIDPGPGTDTVDAGSDNDVVLARDGAVDQIGCGVGADFAQVDAQDIINADDGSICERLEVLGGPPPPAPGPLPAAPGALPPASPMTNTGTGNPNARTISLAAPARAALRAVFRTGVLALAANAPGAGTVTTVATVDRATARRVRAAATKRVTIGTARATVTKAGSVELRLRLTPRARKGIKRVRSLKVRLVTTFRPTGGAVRTTTRTITLKR